MSKPTVKLDNLVSIVTDKIVVGKEPSMPYVGLEHLEPGCPDLAGWSRASDSISTNSVFEAGDVLFGKLRPNLRKCVSAPFSGYCSTDLLVLRPREHSSSGFAARQLQSETVFRAAVGTAAGTKMPRTSWKDLRGLRVFGPPLPQQQKIAEILDTVDEAIRKTDQIIAKLKQVKQGLLHDLLTRGIDDNGELRDPERHPEQFKDSPLGRIPKAWEAVDLGQMAVLVTSGSRGWARFYSETGALFIRSQNVRMGHLDLSDEQRVQVRTDEGQRNRVAGHDLLITITGNSVGNVAMAPADWQEPAFVSQHVGLVRLNVLGLTPLVMHYLAQGSPGNQQILDAQYGQSKPGLNLDNLRDLVIPVPNSEERDEIVERLWCSQIKIEREAAYSSKLRLLKAGLMEDLLTGKVRTTNLLEPTP